MALSVEAANEYINRMTIDNEDWNDYDDAKQQAEAKARQAADATAKAVSQAALLAFIASLLGAFAAMFGALKSAAHNYTYVTPAVVTRPG